MLDCCVADLFKMLTYESMLRFFISSRLALEHFLGFKAVFARRAILDARIYLLNNEAND